MKKLTLSSLALVAMTCSLLGSEGQASAHEATRHQFQAPVVDNYKITILSDSIPGRNTTGEWGFSALVEVTSAGATKRVLFDTGYKAQTVRDNAKVLGINLCDIEDVVLSHHHKDHVGGLDTLRKECASSNPNAMSKVHVGGPEMFLPRVDKAGTQRNPMVEEKSLYEAQGGTFVVDEHPHELLVPGMFLTGHIRRNHSESARDSAGHSKLYGPGGRLSEDFVPEEQALVINTSAGVVVLTGCGHAGAANTIEQAVRMVGGRRPNVTLAGGFHWDELEQGDRRTEGTLDWEVQAMAELNVVGMLGGHSTGFERFAYVRDALGLDQSRAAMSAVGMSMALSPNFTYTLPQAFNSPIPMNPQRAQGNTGWWHW